MTTYTVPAVEVAYDAGLNPVAARTVDLDMVFPDGHGFINYSVLNDPPGALPAVQIGGGRTYNQRLDGQDLPTFVTGSNNVGFVRTAIDRHEVILTNDASNGRLLMVFAGGDDLPFTIGGLQEYRIFDSIIEDVGAITSGPFAPGRDIPVASFRDVSVTEDDRIVFRTEDFGEGQVQVFHTVQGGQGNDTIDMGKVDPATGLVVLDYAGLSGPVTARIDGGQNTGSVVKPGIGTDTLIDVRNPLALSLDGGRGGLEIFGTAAGDTFDLRPEFFQWVSVRAGDGVDAVAINGTGLVRLDFRDATQGIDVDLSARQIGNDGFGNAESIGGTSPVWEVFGSVHDDVVNVSGNDALRYRYGGGNNTLTGADGVDRLRYDVGQVQRIEADLQTGRIRVETTSGPFTDSVSGIDFLRGSDGHDVIGGDSGDNMFVGHGGIDTFVHRGGADTISDFDPLTERLIVEIDGVTQADVDAAIAAADAAAGNALVSFGGSTVLFERVGAQDAAGIDATSDFVPPELELSLALVDRGGSPLVDATVTFTPDDGNAARGMEATAAPGVHGLALPVPAGGRIDVTRDFDAGTDPVIGVADALNALRIAVGLDPSFGPAQAHDLVAADISRDGAVGVDDALEILRFAVGLDPANAPQWVFPDPDQDLSGIVRDSVTYDSGIDTGLLDANASLAMTGILLGSVQGLPEL